MNNMKCPFLRRKNFKNICSLSPSAPLDSNSCIEFWNCELYRNSTYIPKITKVEKNALRNYEKMINRYVDYLTRLEELFLRGKIEPQVYFILHEKYEKRIVYLLKIIKGVELT